MSNEKENGFVKPDSSIIKEKQKAGWIKAWFAIEVVAVGEDVATNAIQKHMERMLRAKNSLITDLTYSNPIESKNLTEAMKKKMEEKGDGRKPYSVTAEVNIYCKNLVTLLELVMMYGPSAIEILEPKEVEVPVDEIQNIANIFSGILHQFAASGVGGMVISTDKKKE